VKVVFNADSRQDFRKARKHYAGISQRRVDDFDHQVKEVIRTIIERKGGDHVGPHGFPCRRCPPYPYLVYYRIAGETLLILGLVHERRHPDHLRRDLEGSTD
jgi:plasmid stabilization system protein ParE